MNAVQELKKTYPRLGSEARVWKPKPLTSVTILAMGASSAMYMTGRFQQPKWETEQIWTINTAAKVFKCDLAFNMHDLEELQKAEPDKDYLGVYKDYEGPLVTIRALEQLPCTLEYPLAEIVEFYQESYFAVALSYLVAAAAWAGASDIRIYGADFNYPGRNAYEAGRANLEYWIGLVKGKCGAVVSLPEQTLLCDMYYRTGDRKGAMKYGKVYGYFDRQPVFDSGKLIRFEDPPVTFSAVEASIGTGPTEG